MTVSRRLPIWPAAGLVALSLLAGCASTEAGDSAGESKDTTTQAVAEKKAKPFTVSGTVILGAGDFKRLKTGSAACIGKGKFKDVEAGTQVVVVDKAGDVIGLSELATDMASDGTGACTFTFEIPNVPPGMDSYGVEVAKHGVKPFTEKKLAEPVTVTLG